MHLLRWLYVPTRSPRDREPTRIEIQVMVIFDRLPEPYTNSRKNPTSISHQTTSIQPPLLSRLAGLSHTDGLLMT